MRSTLVSIVITNYNYARFLSDAIDSALAQTYRNTEVVVIDDGSTDNSREVLARYGSRISCVFQPNGGQAAAFDAGFRAARGDIICLLDADDTWREDKIEKVVAAFQQHSHAMWLRHSLVEVDEQRCPTGQFVPQALSEGAIPAASALYLEHAVSAATSSIALRREAAARIFPLPPIHFEFFKYDADALLIALIGGLSVEGLTISEHLGEYRRHGQQQFAAANRFIALLERQVAVAERTSAIWSDRHGQHRTATSVFKHKLVLHSLSHASRTSPVRIAIVIDGLRAAFALLRSSPRLAIRQTVALLFAFAAPTIWVRRQGGGVAQADRQRQHVSHSVEGEKRLQSTQLSEAVLSLHLNSEERRTQ